MPVDIPAIAADPPLHDPFAIGRRPVTSLGPDGQPRTIFIPMTEEDFLHPQLEDRLSLTEFHTLAVFDLRHAIVTKFRDDPRLRVLCDHLVDWQISGLRPHAPDVVVFQDISPDWDFRDGKALRVRDAGARVLAVMEVTSPSTRHIDLGTKLEHFARVGIPYYLVVDLASPDGRARMLGYRLVGGVYDRQDPVEPLGYYIAELRLWFDLVADRVQVADEDGNILPDATALADERDSEKARAEGEKRRAEAEKRRAETEKARAEQALAAAEAEKARAEQAETDAAAEKARAEAEKARAEAEKARAEEEKARAGALARELAELKARLEGGN